MSDVLTTQNEFLRQTRDKALNGLRSYIRCCVVSMLSWSASILSALIAAATISTGTVSDSLSTGLGVVGILMFISIIVASISWFVALVWEIISIFRFGDLNKSLETHVAEEQRDARINEFSSLSKSTRTLLFVSLGLRIVSSLFLFKSLLLFGVLSVVILVAELVVFFMIMSKNKAMKQLGEPQAS